MANGINGNGKTGLQRGRRNKGAVFVLKKNGPSVKNAFGRGDILPVRSVFIQATVHHLQDVKTTDKYQSKTKHRNGNNPNSS